ncbi:hypothetical protein ABPG77_001278 [Micractinium sp. CCAP 211/92]
MVLECAAQPPRGSGGAVAGAVAVQPQAVPASTGSVNTWELIYSRKSSTGLNIETPVLQAAPRRPTAAPATVAGQPGADPRLVQLTQQLIARAGRPAEMQALLARQTLEAADVRRLLTYLDRQGAADVALDAFHAMKPLPHFHTDDPVLRTKLIKMHSRRPKDTAAALALYDEMVADGVAPDAVCYNTALAAAGLGQHWDRVLSILEDMGGAGVPWDAFTCSALLSACQACGQWEQALDWFRQAQSLPGLQLNVVHYTTLMSCLQKAGQWEQSMRVFKEMEGQGIVPDVVAHNAAIAACAKGGEWEKAWAVFLAMKQAGLRPSTVSYNALISACERCGQADRALEVFASMQRQQVAPNTVTYNTIISACAKAGLYARAQALHAEMQAAGVPDDVFTLTALITACERIGHWQGAEQHFQEFQRRGIQPNTVAFNRLISALGRGGQWEQALAAFQAMQQPPAEQLQHQQQPGGSRRDAGSSSGRARNSVGESSSSSSLRHPVPSLQAAAAPVVEPMSRPAGAAAPAPAGQRLRARRRGSRGGGSRGGSDSDAPEPVVYTPTPTARPDRITYGSLIAALERGGQWERALAVFEDMQAQGIQPNGYIFTSLVNACEKGGQWETAVRLFKAMQARDIPLDSMAMVARKALYAFPSLIKIMPAPMLDAARATVDSGRAARQWIEKQRPDS